MMVADCAGEEVPLLRMLPILQRLIRLTDAHKQYGLTKSQTVVMLALYYRESINMSEIAQYISSSKEQATRVVAALCDQGLVERFGLPDNRTHVFIRFTQKGRAFMQQVGQQMRAELARRLNSSLTPEELQTLRQSVQTSVELLSKVQ